MKNFIIALLFIGLIPKAFAWPRNMYTIENLFTEQFSTLRTYIQNLKLNYPYKKSNNLITFYSDLGQYREIIFRIKLKREIDVDYIKEKLIFIGVRGEKENFIFERWGNNIRPLDISRLSSFNFSIPQNVSAFRFEFQRLKIYQKVEFFEGVTKSNYRLYDYGLEINHVEQIREYNLHSKLWYQCDKCTGDPIIAIMDTRTDFYGNMTYKYGIPLKVVTPKEFYAKANRSYLSGIFREFRNLKDEAIDIFGWPLD